MGCSADSLKGSENKPDVRDIFEDCAWLYAFCREHLFRDQTEEIARALFADGTPSGDVSLLEVGCGPGFYARRLAKRFPNLRVLGIDRSSRLISGAKARAAASGLTNCRFSKGDVESLSSYVEPVDCVISSRLLLVVADRSGLIAEMFRVLKPGGRLFLAEPTANFKSQLPISAMRFVTRLSISSRRQSSRSIAAVVPQQDFEELVRSQPWSTVSIRRIGDYQCAVCQKSSDTSADAERHELEEGRVLIADARSIA